MTSYIKTHTQCIGLFAILLLGALLIVGCSESDMGEDESGNGALGTQPAAFIWSEGSDCGSCHANEALSFGDEACLAREHVQESCLSCHTDAKALSEIHGDATPDQAANLKKLKATTVADEECVACHEEYSALALKSADSEILTDSNGKTVNPHTVTTTENAEGQHKGIACIDCHKVHSTKPLDETAITKCIQCHHSGTYECYTCHD